MCPTLLFHSLVLCTKARYNFYVGGGWVVVWCFNCFLVVILCFYVDMVALKFYWVLLGWVQLGIYFLCGTFLSRGGEFLTKNSGKVDWNSRQKKFVCWFKVLRKSWCVYVVCLGRGEWCELYAINDIGKSEYLVFITDMKYFWLMITMSSKQRLGKEVGSCFCKRVMMSTTICPVPTVPRGQT